MSTPPTEGSERSAEALFAAWLVAREDGRGESLEELCAARPEAAAELRRLHAQHEELADLKRRFGLAGSLAGRLVSRFGPQVDPGIELEPEDEGPVDFTARVVDRLAERNPVSTRYRMKGRLAEGGMGAILRVWDEDLRRHLAMKVILGRREAPSDKTPPVDRRSLARFLEEAQVTGQLDHPGIVPVHELGIDERGRAYFTMKLVKGRDLKAVFDLVREGAEGWNQVKALGVLLRVCEAMSYAHDKGVIHRDLKPANVMVGRYGEVYVMDWGLARILGRADERDIRLRPESASSGPTVIRSDRREHASDTPDSPLCTMDGDVVGTPAYMPPEQANGELDAMGPHSDVYAVGAMLYHLVAGHMPYLRPGEKASNYSVLRWVKDGPPHPLHAEAPGAPAELVAIADKAMARDPRLRYPDMSALARDLAAYLEGRVVAAYETGALAEAKKWVRRNKALATALAAALVILVAGIVTSLLYAGEARREAARADREAESAQALAAKEADARRTAEHLREEGLSRERELRVRGLIQDLAALDAAGRSFDYARRQGEPSHVWWPRQARLLLEGQEDPWRPGLAEAERRLAELRAQAEPYAPEEAREDRATHPRAGDLELKHAELLWRRRMLGLEPWPELAGIEAGLAEAPHAGSAAAWRLVDPDAPVHGEESRALLLATRAAGAASDAQQAGIHDALARMPLGGAFRLRLDAARAQARGTLAWAQYRRGMLDEARATMSFALERAPAAWRGVLEEEERRLAQALATWRDGRARAALAELEAEILELERVVTEQRTWRFAESEDEWWHLQLAALVLDLHRLQERLGFVERSVATPEAQALWQDAIAAIEAAERYGGLKLTPQIGLLPIGPDPTSGLWEFAHLQSGEPARRGADGRLVLTGETGLVFVLLPGGRFWMGAQKDDPDGRNYDPQAGGAEGPVHEVELSPFFLSKHEMARGPWRRIATWASPYWSVSALDAANSVSWDDCMAALARADAWITLCTEAQWEYACRAGTETPWWTGSEAESLRGRENVAIDGRSVKLLPIGQRAPNPFGLHDMHGNLWEWCLDGHGGRYSSELRVDPLHPWEGAGARVIRGGFYWPEPEYARSSDRHGSDPGGRHGGLGLRPARRITP